MRLIFLASDNPTPSGGLKFIYRFCELATEIGYPSAILHAEPGFAISGFSHEATVLHHTGWKQRSRLARLKLGARKGVARLFRGYRDADIHADDIIVLPENRLPRANEIFPRNRKILICQGYFLALKSGGPPRDHRVLGGFGVSNVTVEAARRLLPGCPVHHVPLWLENGVFHPDGPKANRIAYMPRRNAADAAALFSLLRRTPAFEGWDVVPIDGQPVATVARVLQGSRIFLSFADREGFGLPAAEAIACGCHAIGYTGIGGDEYFDRFGATAIPAQDLFKFADGVSEVLAAFAEDPDAMDRAAKREAERIVEAYSREKTCAALAIALQDLTGSPPTVEPPRSRDRP